MRIISKRRTRYLLIIILVITTIILFVKATVQFQMNREIKHYKKFFRPTKGAKALSSFNPLDIKQIPSETIDELYEARLMLQEKKNELIDWSKFAYVNYVTAADYLCNTLIMFNSLKNEYHTEAQLVLLVSKRLLDTKISRDVDQSKFLLEKIQNLDEKQVVIKYIDDIIKPNDYTPWNESLTKLLIFNETSYDRIIFMDNDADLVDSMDELFFLPKYVKFAAPLTYWFLTEEDCEKAVKEMEKKEKVTTNLDNYIDQLSARIKREKPIYNDLPSLPPHLYLNSDNIAEDIISSTSSASPLFAFGGHKASKVKFASNLMVISPEAELFQYIVDFAIPSIIDKKSVYDMDLVNDDLYNLKRIIYNQFSLFRKMRSKFLPEVLVLPYTRYGLLTGSIRNEKQHSLISNDILGFRRYDENRKPIDTPFDVAVERSKYVHFSDYPIGKPWNYPSIHAFECKPSGEASELEKNACSLWNSVYEQYLEKRHICMATIGQENENELPQHEKMELHDIDDDK